jgi:hypothetical protein
MITRGIAIDVEAINSDWAHPEKSGIKCVTVLDFEFDDTFVGGTSCMTFEESSLKLLQEKLVKHEGVILGHNLFSYDYRILSSRINLHGIIEKTINLVTWLEERNDVSDFALGFHGLVKLNIEGSQRIATGLVKKLWLDGRKQEVFDSNMEDCISLLELYGQLLFQRILLLPLKKRGERNKTFRRISINDTDLEILTGRHRYFLSEDWDKMIESQVDDNYWARELRGGRFGKCPDRYYSIYEAFRCKDKKKAAIIYYRRHRRHKLNKVFDLSKIVPDTLDKKLNAAFEPEFIGYCKADVLHFPGASQGPIFSDKGTSFGTPTGLPPAVKKHLKSIKHLIDDPNLYSFR